MAALVDDNHTETSVELYFRASLWMDKNLMGRDRKTAAEITGRRFGVSRATAYRWVRAYRAAKGVA